MSKFRNFLIRIGINTAAVDAIGGRLLGVGALLNATNAGGYMNPNRIDGYTHNPSDGLWYGSPPQPDYGQWAWLDPASPGQQVELSRLRYWRELNNHVEHASPDQGSANDLSVPSLWDILENLPKIVEEYKRAAPELWRELKDYLFPSPFPERGSLSIDPATNANWQSAQRPPPRDPLAIDLDGDGIETLGIPSNGTSPILFDHNADGVRTGTGWLRPDDAWLVLDRNGNGTIDSGRELFGVDTVITRTLTSPSGTYSFETTAATGFEALRSLDANGDRVLNAADAAFTQVLRVSADAVQDEQRGAVFLATLQMEQTHLNIDGKRIALAPGMNLSAEVKTGKRRVIDYLLAPVQAAAGESLRER